MRTSLFLFSVLMVVTSLTSFIPTDAGATPGPFNPATYLRFIANEADIDSLENGELLLKLPHNFATTPGVSGATLALGGSLPAGTYVTGVSVVVETDIISANNNTLALGCETASDLDAADDLSTESVNAVLPGEPRVGTESTWVYSAAGCVPTLTVGIGASGITAGRAIYLIKYLQAETQ